ncbi:hypothetical protein CC1G_03224 [Coprinopsis cinerea okayama7|uniref:Expansin-like EG45 domain-containing protein n=1 Tax=Coprinopsis cinerea (strain Okayama-7 / 130 / ATCC MYA-4618 / FGSC 9003) TaxID=240176 RepID=A8N781_COPC7|nr:hypothetical protein CC1G_03224 [Coprinopsis cinerea okayama7\|eukprot:XP_001830687.1 hypothetical protein CC1G_03224 [Coprinopsis cinerea okayama7\
MTRPSSGFYGLASLFVCLFGNTLAQWIDYPPDGLATLTHYTLPRGYVASCGCTPETTHYPTAALSQMAYGSSANYGPACGKCFKLTLLNPIVATPPFYPEETKSIVVKIVDLCPLSESGWCSGTTKRTNSAGAQLNFDLAYPSKAIPDDFFPHDEELYGYKDFGVWNITYSVVPCLQSWEGRKNKKALGSVDALGSSGCCPADPTGNSNDTCTSFSDQNGLPPDTRIGEAQSLNPVSYYSRVSFLAVLIASFLFGF